MNLIASDIKVLARGLQFPEGPVVAPDGSLWIVELKGGNLVRCKNGAVDRVHVGGAPNGNAIDENGLLWFCDAAQNSIRSFDIITHQTKTVVTHVDGKQLSKPNDLAFDKMGNLVFTCPGNSRQKPAGYACVLMKDGTVKKIATGKYFPNGVAFTADGRSLVMAETYKHRLWKGPWDANKGEWTNTEVWCDVGGPNGPGGPDGMAFCEDGNLYVAVFGTGKIKLVDKSGDVITEISVPGQNPTNCAFNTAGNLIVTETERGELLEVDLSNSLKLSAIKI